jgi:hypothetical protein
MKVAQRFSAGQRYKKSDAPRQGPSDFAYGILWAFQL